MKLGLIFCILICLSEGAFANPSVSSKSVEAVASKVLDLYNKHQYEESIKLLNTVANGRDSNVMWYYYYGLNLFRLDRYDEALINFNTFIKNSEVENTAKAYYYVGLVQFYQGEYEKALNSLELSSDVSKDPKLDKTIEALIDKTIKYQDYNEKHKGTNITILAGYNYDTDVINLNGSSFTEGLGGHVLSYGISLAHRFVDLTSFVFEPSLTALDNYTLDNSLKAVSTLQATDMLQFLITAPFQFNFSNDTEATRYNVSLNAYTAYLPINTGEREQYLSSFYLKTKIARPLNLYSINLNATIATDKSYGFSSSDDDASGLRSELSFELVRYLSKDKISSLNYELSAATNAPNGINSKYNKYGFTLAYIYSSFWETTSFVRLGYDYLKYPTRFVPRSDNKVVVSYSINKIISTGTNVGVSLTCTNNSSNTELYKYSDVTLGLQYTANFGF